MSLASILTTEDCMSISEFLLPEFDAEAKATRTTLQRVPFDKPDFVPHPKSMPLKKLAPHVAQLAGFGLVILTTPKPKPPAPPCSEFHSINRILYRIPN